MNEYKAYFTIFFTFLFVISPSFDAINFQKTLNNYSYEENDIKVKKFIISISETIIDDYKEKQKIEINKTRFSDNENPGKPYHSFHTTFPIKTEIIDVKCEFLKNNSAVFLKKSINKEDSWYTHKIGGGIDKEKHVTFLSIKFYPILDKNEKNHYLNNIEIEIKYRLPKSRNENKDKYKLLILTPNIFKKQLQRLANHKNSYGFSTKLVTLNQIYNDIFFKVDGRDKTEEIKYFLYKAYKNWNINYVLLVGNINKIPIRNTWIGYGSSIKNPITDLYYADICFPDGSFCSWDSNNNGYYGEVNHENRNDLIDLYPDLYVGRLACNNLIEVQNIIRKIINYEESAKKKEWTKKIILAGGDTHPVLFNFFEGEFVIEKIKEVTPLLTHIMLKTSDDTYSADKLNKEINDGAGFLCYSGHGFETGLGTHPPNSQEWISYYLYDLIKLKNNNKLPIVFFSACLTARIDYNILNLISDISYELSDKPKLSKPKINFPILFSCFAWRMVAKPNGGAIATIGATRIAYSLIDNSGIYGGCSYLALKFFESYSESEYLSHMLVSAKNDYLNKGSWIDYLTLEEFILLGDPSLKIGGYN